MTGNSDEGAFWSGPSGAKWIEHEAEQDHFLSEVAKAVLDKAAPERGARVLDIGCGTGAVTLMAADAVGPDGRVLATDIAEPFVSRVAERANGLPHVATFLGDAQSATWPEAGFDVAVSRFGVMFFSDPAKAFANIASALRIDGRIVFAAWGATEDNPYWSIPRALIADRLGPQPKPLPNAPGPMGLADAGWAVEQLRAGGLVDVGVETRIVELLHEGGALGAASLGLKIGPAARALSEADGSEAEISAFRSDAARAFEQYEKNGQARIPATVHLFTARRS